VGVEVLDGVVAALVGALVVALVVVLLLPQPARSTPPTSETASHADDLRIIGVSLA